MHKNVLRAYSGSELPVGHTGATRLSVGRLPCQNDPTTFQDLHATSESGQSRSAVPRSPRTYPLALEGQAAVLAMIRCDVPHIL